MTRDKYPYKDNLSIEFTLASDSELRSNDDLNSIRLKIIEINNECRDKTMKIEIEKLFQILLESVIAFKREVDKHFYGIPIFEYYDMSRLFNHLQSLRNDGLVNFKSFIKER